MKVRAAVASVVFLFAGGAHAHDSCTGSAEPEVEVIASTTRTCPRELRDLESEGCTYTIGEDGLVSESWVGKTFDELPENALGFPGRPPVEADRAEMGPWKDLRTVMKYQVASWILRGQEGREGMDLWDDGELRPAMDGVFKIHKVDVDDNEIVVNFKGTIEFDDGELDLDVLIELERKAGTASWSDGSGRAGGIYEFSRKAERVHSYNSVAWVPTHSFPFKIKER